MKIIQFYSILFNRVLSSEEASFQPAGGTESSMLPKITASATESNPGVLPTTGELVYIPSVVSLLESHKRSDG